MQNSVTIPVLRTRKLKNRNSIVVSHGLFTIVATLDILLDGKSTLGERVGLFFFVFILAMLGVARYLNAININNRPKLHLMMYCLAICTGIIFFGRIGTIFAYSWLLVLFLTYTYYGIKAAFGSLLLFASTLEGQLLFKAYQTGEGINKESISIMLMQLGIISAMALFFFDTEKAAEDDHEKILNSMEQTQLEHQRIISLVNNMTDGVIATDDQGFITLYNASALGILDTNQSLSGKKINSVLEVVDKRRRKVDILKLCINNKGYVDSKEYRLRYNNKEVINLHLIISQIKSGFKSQDLKGFMMTFHDITKEKSLEEERDEFISVISHELRTPVAVMEANISNAQFMIEKNQSPETIKTSLDNAHSQAIYLAGMLNDLTTLGKAENSQLSSDLKPIHPVEILETLYNNYSRPARDKGLRIYKKINDDTPATIVSNGLYVQEILQNFMSNAIKYTKSGRISIVVEGAESGVKFSVKDTGIGISKSDLTKIFNKFYRSEDYRTRETSGNGLGLYIAKKLAKIIEAEFEIQTVINSGSTFTLFVPDMKNKRPK